MEKLPQLTAITQSWEEKEEEFLNAELTRNELEYLRYRVKLLEQITLEQSQELTDANREMELMNRELQQMAEERQLTLNKAIELVNDLVVEEKLTRDALVQVLGAIYGETVVRESLAGLSKSLDHPSLAAQPIVLLASSPNTDQSPISPGFTESQALMGSPTSWLQPKPVQKQVKLTKLAEQERVMQEILTTSRRLSASLRQAGAMHKQLIAQSIVKSNDLQQTIALGQKQLASY